MKILKTWSGQEYILQDEEADNIVKIKNSPSKKAFLQLRCGAYVDISAIESISGVPLIAHSQEGQPLSKDGRSYIRDSIRIYVEDFDSIQYLPDPKYRNIPTNQFQIEEPKKQINEY